MSFRCDRCSTCCKTHRVPITLADLNRLLTFLDQGPDANFIEWLSPAEIDMQEEPESFLLLREGQRLLVLRHVPSQAELPSHVELPRHRDAVQSIAEAVDSQCIFLNANGCSVHEARPLACRTYPFDRPSREQPLLQLGLAPRALCPPTTGINATLQADPEYDAVASDFTQAIIERDRELLEYAKLVEQHNTQARLRIRMNKLPLTGQATLKRLVLLPLRPFE